MLSRLTDYAFDILKLGKQDLRTLPLLERKLALEMVLKNAKALGILYSEHQTGFAKELFDGACKMNLEGLIAKVPTQRQLLPRWLRRRVGKIRIALI